MGKNKGGRPRLDITEKRIKDVRLKLNLNEYNKLKDLLDNSNYTTYPDLIRDILFEKSIKVYKVDKSKEQAIHEFSKAANNINQIAHKLNSNPNPKQLVLNKKDVQKLDLMLDKFRAFFNLF